MIFDYKVVSMSDNVKWLSEESSPGEKRIRDGASPTTTFTFQRDVTNPKSGPGQVVLDQYDRLDRLRKRGIVVTLQ